MITSPGRTLNFSSPVRRKHGRRDVFTVVSRGWRREHVTTFNPCTQHRRLLRQGKLARRAEPVVRWRASPLSEGVPQMPPTLQDLGLDRLSVEDRACEWVNGD